MFLDLGGEDVTVLTPTERTAQTVAPLEPRPTGETAPTAENLADSGWVLYLPAGDPITRGASVLVRGAVYRVTGQPAVWGDMCVVVQVNRVGNQAVVTLRGPSAAASSYETRGTTLTPGAPYATAVPAHIAARAVRSTHDADSGEEELPVSPYIVQVDLDVAPNEGDEVAVVSADDATLAGRVLRIDHVVRGGDAGTRQLFCSMVALTSTD